DPENQAFDDITPAHLRRAKAALHPGKEDAQGSVWLEDPEVAGNVGGLCLSPPQPPTTPSLAATMAKVPSMVLSQVDLRTTGKKFLPSDINGGKVEKPEGPCVLKIQKFHNVSAPKDNEESQAAPRMLRLQMTDGHISCTAVEYSYTSKISLSTPPGTKNIKNGFLLLNDTNTTVLGSEVELLIEKWELQRNLSKHNRSSIGTEGGPPPFVPFGQKCISYVQVDSRDLD
ncbi:hypothetical protein MC885_009128, partial [Smutsia gigantea]